ncbi:MAG: biotin/lipoate A/B protein ligase family protein [Gemmatimonadota bacterium]
MPRRRRGPVAPGRQPGESPSAAIRLLWDEPAPGPWNMALDEALMETARRGVITLRLYGWSPPCLSLGRNQRARGFYDAGAAGARGIGIVRRPTGGRAVYHGPELTYSVAAPTGQWGSLRESYGRINGAIARGLSELGVPVALAGAGGAGAGGRGGESGPARVSRPGAHTSAERVHGRETPRPRPGSCFQHPLPGEVTVTGRKLVGSAQWRRGGAFLQHGSLLLRDEQALVRELGRTPPGGGEAALAGRGERSIGLAEVCETLPSLERLGRALCRGFEAEFQLPVRRGAASAEERGCAGRLEEEYADAAWTWRR